MAVKPLWNSPPQFVDANGDPYSGALLFFYVAGSSTKQDTFTNSGGGTPCDNPITLNSSGYPAVSGTIVAPWGTVGQTYKIGLAAPGSSDPPNSFIWTEDNVGPINDTTSSQTEWIAGPTPTFVSTTSFTLVGDQTSTFEVGRRVKTTNSGGTVYSTITASAFGAATTVTVLNDSGVLDSGLSAVSYGLLDATHPSIPFGLFSGGLGAANTKIFVNAAGTALGFASGLSIITFTRDMTATGGTVAYTGVGFKPALVIFLAADNSTSLLGISSIGVDNGTLHKSITPYYGTAGVFLADPSDSISLSESGTQSQLAVISALGADGFSLTWTKNGSPSAGTATIFAICFR